MYSAKLLEHFENPRNTGDLRDADATAEIENPVCGDVIRIAVKMQAGRIQQIRFKAKGCVPTMACASAMTEMVQGLSVKEARTIQRDQLIDAVGGLPPASTHAAQLVLDALAAALLRLETPIKPGTIQGN